MGGGYKSVMAILVHELWNDFDDDGTAMPALLLAGPAGDSPRLFMSPAARLVRRFEAENYREAMAIFYALNGWESLDDEPGWDDTPYPDDWAEVQALARAARADC